MNMIRYFYDKEADVFYLSQGAPRVSDETIEAGDDVLLRVARGTRDVRGITILNAASRKGANTAKGAPIPVAFAMA